MKLSETTFDQFLNWCEEEKEYWHTEREYITIPKLKVIYDYCVKYNMQCKGVRCTVTWKRNEFISCFSQPLEYQPTEKDFIWNMFHDVWCKAEWAIRCTKTDRELGYESVKADFGIQTIKELKEAA